MNQANHLWDEPTELLQYASMAAYDDDTTEVSTPPEAEVVYFPVGADSRDNNVPGPDAANTPGIFDAAIAVAQAIVVLGAITVAMLRGHR